MQLFQFALQALQDPLQAAAQMTDMGISPADLESSIVQTEAQIGQMMKPQAQGMQGQGGAAPTQMASAFSGMPQAGTSAMDAMQGPQAFPLPQGMPQPGAQVGAGQTPQVQPAVASAQRQPQAQLASLGEDGLPDPSEVETYIRQRAEALGHDPDVAVEVARHEGLQPGVWQSNVKAKNGVREPSFGPFQLLVGGEETGFPAGMGNEFMQETGQNPADPSTWQQQVDFVMDKLPQTGWRPFYGADAAGVADFEGVNTAARLDPSSQQLATSADTSRTGSSIDFARAAETSLPTPPTGTVPASGTGQRLMAAKGGRQAQGGAQEEKKKSLSDRLKAFADLEIPEAPPPDRPPSISGGGPNVGGGFSRNPQAMAQLFALLGGGGPPAGQSVTPPLSQLIRGA